MTGAAARRPVALVTGGRRGIGGAIARGLAGAGFDVAVNDVEEDADAEATCAAIRAAGGRALFVAADVADTEGHAALLDSVEAGLGVPDCLVSNAGVSVRVRGDLLDVTPESYDRCFSVNTRAAFFLAQATARRMLSASGADGAAGGPRSLIFVTSVNAAMASPDRGEYCMSKTAASMMAKLFALRLAPHGIHVHEIRPGVIRTAMTAVARERYDRRIAEGLSPIARWGEPEDVAACVVALAAGRLPFATGDAYHVDGGLHLHQL